MARFLTGARPIVSKISANAIIAFAPFSLLLKNSMAQAIGGSNPNIATLKIDAKCSLRRPAVTGISVTFPLHRAPSSRLVRGERARVDGPVCAIVIS